MSELTVLTEAFERLGFEIIYYSGIANANGPDMWVKKKGRPLSVEIKTARRKKGNTWAVDPVEPLRQKDDLIAIICPIGKYVLIESMVQHLKNCSKSGDRPMTLLLGEHP